MGCFVPGVNRGTVALFDRVTRWAGVMVFGQIAMVSSLNAVATRS